ncbi:MAG: hypothetical protein ACXVED_16975, partial [Bacteroidia bacterium]
VIKSKTYPFPGEIWDGEEFSDLPCEYSWLYKEDIEQETDDWTFLVYGFIVDEEINTTFRFKKGFKNAENANFFFDTFKKKYPKASLVIGKKNFQYVRHYH